MKYVAIERNSECLLGDVEVFDTEEQAINAALKAIDEPIRNRVDRPRHYTVAIEQRLQVDTKDNDYKSEEVELNVRADYHFDRGFTIRKVKA